MTKYGIKRFSSLERRLYDDSEKKKDSGFSWGKALGATAAVAGTMYGAKKGMFGSRIQRGYNTAYGKLGNALGSQSMVNSAARDWAIGSVKNPGSKGSKMQYNRDIINKQNEFKSQFNKNSSTVNPGNSSPAPAPAPAVKQDVTTAKENVSPFLTGTGFNNNTSSKPSFDNLLGSGNKVQPGKSSIMSSSAIAPKVEVKPEVAAAPSIFEEKKAEIRKRLGTYKNQGPTTIKEINQATAQREEMAQMSRYQQGKKRKKITSQEQQQRINNVRQTLGKNQYNSKNQNSKGFNAKKPEVPVAATANDYYNNPYNEFRMAAYSYSGVGELKNQRFFSEKEDSSRKKKIRNAALLGAGTLALGATIYGIKKDKNKKKKIKETAKQGSKTIKELKKKKESVITNLKNSEKELEGLHKKAKALANGEYKYTDRDLESFNKFMEDKNSVLHL